MHKSILKIFYSYSLCLLITLLPSACSYNTLPTSDSSTALPAISKPKNIALLVPIERANGSSGQAIRNGFLAAYYYAKQTMSDAPAVNVIDTSNGNITALYQQAVNEGADFVVGPLTKSDLQTLATQDHLTVPTLALNTLANASGTVKNLYQFGLLPQDEAEQAATRAKQDGYSRALIIVPAGNWGAEIAKSFTQKWQQLDGSVGASFTYSPRGNMSLVVQNALHAAKSDQNIDVVFLAAFPSYARQIKPLLTFYESHTLPVYATSLVYEGFPSGQDNDLNGIIFNDMPWIIGAATPAWNQIRGNIQALWGNSYKRSPRLYALGIDAYHLTYTLNQLSSGVDGATGKLTLDTKQRIRRTLDWAKFQDGAPQRIQ